MTILDIAPKPKKTQTVDKIYSVKSIYELFGAINDALKINPVIESIQITRNVNIDEVLFNTNHGLNLFNYTNKGEVKFRGFTRWVYFKNDTPIFFDSACSQTDTPPHTATFKSSVYETLEFDRFEKIEF
jgi:hypothetical protein